jgi:hypothetical protein
MVQSDDSQPRLVLDNDSGVTRKDARREPEPTIYVKLMPLMYGLIGATSALLLSGLIWGNPPFSFVLHREKECKPQAAPAAAAVAAARPPPAGAAPAPAAPQVSPAPAGETAPVRKAAAPVHKAAAPVHKAAAPVHKAAAPVRKAAAPVHKAVAVRKAAVRKARPAAPAPGKAAAAHRPAPGKAAPASRKSPGATVKAAIGSCVSGRARSFRLAVRVHRDGKVRRVFVARDPGVTAAMSACIENHLTDLTLPIKYPRKGYAEWRVSLVDGMLALKLVRPARLRPR